jgi:DNA-binding transcriptional LysR family regulator
MEMRALQCFVSVAELLSFSAAAHKLGVSQSAVSRQVKLMEQELGLLLFDRVGRRVFLTPAGRDLLERSYEVQKGMVSLTARAHELSAGTQGTLRIGATPQTLESVVARIVPSFMRKHPEVRITLVEDGSVSLGGALERGTIDLAIGAMTSDRGFESCALFPLVALVAMPESHRLARRRNVEIAELAEEEMLLLRPDFMTRQIYDGACKVAHIAPRILLESASPHCLLALVQSGLGLAVIPSTVRFTKADPRAVPLTQNGRALGLWMHALWDPRRYTPPAAHNFIVALRGQTRADYPGKSLRIGHLLTDPRVAKARVLKG